MSDIVTFCFKAREEDIPRWERAFSLLEKGQFGAKFQKEMDEFGEAVAEQFESFIEEYGVEGLGGFGYWERSGTDFECEFEMPSNIAEDFESVLNLCPIKDLELSLPE